MNIKKPNRKNKSLLFVIEDVAKLLRSQAKKKSPSLKTHSPSVSSSGFTKNIEQIAQLLRAQIPRKRSRKKRKWITLSDKDLAR